MNERCVICGKETTYEENTPIDKRRYYIEGSGQLCDLCYTMIYKRT